MSVVFADTFYWIALTNPRDASHERANAYSLSIADLSLVTTEAVLIEYLNYFSSWGPEFRHLAGSNARRILSNPAVHVEPLTAELFSASLDLYTGRPDKGYSLTDCMSMIVMRRAGLMQALSSDRHFEQEGFRAVFRTD